MKLQGVLFDVDGTLLDTTEYIYQAFEHTLKKHHKSLSRHVLQKIMGKPLDTCYQILTEMKDVEKLMEEHRQFQIDNIHLSKPFPNTISALEHVRSRGYRIAAVTTRARKSAKETLESAGIYSYFDYFIGFEDVENPKPHPEPLLKALTYLEVKPEHAIMVGDSEVDVQAGKNAGTKTVGVTYGFHKTHIHKTNPDYLIHDIKEIIDILP